MMVQQRSVPFSCLLLAWVGLLGRCNKDLTPKNVSSDRWYWIQANAWSGLCANALPISSALQPFWPRIKLPLGYLSCKAKSLQSTALDEHVEHSSNMTHQVNNIRDSKKTRAARKWTAQQWSKQRSHLLEGSQVISPTALQEILNLVLLPTRPFLNSDTLEHAIYRFLCLGDTPGRQLSILFMAATRHRTILGRRL